MESALNTILVESSGETFDKKWPGGARSASRARAAATRSVGGNN